MKTKIRKTDGPEYEVVMTGAMGEGDEAVLATVYDGIEPYAPKDLARLYAAAPEMLKALKESEERINQLCEMVNNYAVRLGIMPVGKVKVWPEDWADKARAAIAKAEPKLGVDMTEGNGGR